MNRYRYVALVKQGYGGHYFKFAYLEIEDGVMLPPTINIEDMPYIYAPDQRSIARSFRTSQQNVSRWMKNQEWS